MRETLLELVPESLRDPRPLHRESAKAYDGGLDYLVHDIGPRDVPTRGYRVDVRAIVQRSEAFAGSRETIGVPSVRREALEHAIRCARNQERRCENYEWHQRQVPGPAD